MVTLTVGLMVAQFGWAVESSPPEKKKVTLLDEVVVLGQADNRYKVDESSTGSKINVPLKDIPGSVTVVNRRLIDDTSSVTMNEATRNVSSVTPVMAGGYGFANRYLIRGLSQRFMRDGLTDGPSMNGYYRTMWDVDTMEVLKGPGSAVYGRGEPGGTINVTTKKPVEDFQAEIGVSGGSFGNYETYVDIGGAPAPGFPSRFIAGYQHSDGFRDLEKEIWAVLPTVSYKPDDNQTWTIDYDYRHTEIVPDNYGIVFLNGALVNVDRETKYYSPFNNTEQNIHRTTLQHEWSENDGFTFKNAAVIDVRDIYLLRNGSGTVNAAGAFTGRDAREQTDDSTDFSYEIEGLWKFDTGPLSHQALLGFEYENIGLDTVRSTFTLPNISNVNNPVIVETDPSFLVKSPTFDREIDSDMASVYLQDLIELNEYWKVRGGLRFDNVWFTDDGYYRPSAPVYSYRLVDFEEPLWSWQAGVVYQPVPEHSVYTGVSSGRFINIQTESTILTEVPEESFQVETGLKSDWWGGKVSTNAAFFMTERENYYVTPFGGGPTVPDGKQKTYGVEFDVTAYPVAGLSLSANVAFLDAEFTGDQLSGAVNIKGKDPQSVPQNQSSIWVQYEIQDPQFKGLGFGIGSTSQGSSFADAANVNKVPGYWVGDAAIFYKLTDQEYRIAIKNFTDEEYFTHATFAGAAPGEPLNVLASYKRKF